MSSGSSPGPLADPRTWEQLIERIATHIGEQVVTDVVGRVERELVGQLAAAIVPIRTELANQVRPLHDEVVAASRILTDLRREQERLRPVVTGLTATIAGAVAAAVERIDAAMVARADRLAALAEGERNASHDQLIRAMLERLTPQLTAIRDTTVTVAEQVNGARAGLTRLPHGRAARLRAMATGQDQTSLEELRTVIDDAAVTLRELSNALERLEADVALLRIGGT